jgi:hypothetical protein
VPRPPCGSCAEHRCAARFRRRRPCRGRRRGTNCRADAERVVGDHRGPERRAGHGVFLAVGGWRRIAEDCGPSISGQAYPGGPVTEIGQAASARELRCANLVVGRHRIGKISPYKTRARLRQGASHGVLVCRWWVRPESQAEKCCCSARFGSIRCGGCCRKAIGRCAWDALRSRSCSLWSNTPVSSSARTRSWPESGRTWWLRKPPSEFTCRRFARLWATARAASPMCKM